MSRPIHKIVPRNAGEFSPPIHAHTRTRALIVPSTIVPSTIVLNPPYINSQTGIIALMPCPHSV